MCSSPTHDAVGAFGGLLTLSLLSDQAVNPAGLLVLVGGGQYAPIGLFVLVGCTAVMGIAETRASLRRNRLDAPNVEPRKLVRAQVRAELKAQGIEPREASKRAFTEAYKQIPRPRWEGPAKEKRQRARLWAFVAGCVSAWPVAISYAVSRLPDQLERGYRVRVLKRWTVTIVPRIDHRELTHWPITAGLLLFGLHYGLLKLGHAVGLVTAGDVAATVTLFAGIGYVGHLLADGITRGGVPFLGPLVRDDLFLLPKGKRLLVGGKADALVMLAASGGTVALALTMGGWT